MDDLGSEPEGADSLERFLAAFGPRMDELRALIDGAGARWRGDALRVGEEGRQRLQRLFAELGLVTAEQWEELDLRVAQLEHRLRLVENRLDPPD